MFITHQVRKALNDLDERHNKLAALADEKFQLVLISQ